MRKYGYARVSTKEQKLDRQTVELVKYVDEDFIFCDKMSGKNFDRPNYQLIRKVAQKGDEIYVKSLDRLGRNKAMIKEELEYFKTKGVRIKILDIPTTMTKFPEGQEWVMDMINNLLLEVLSTIAEQERLTTKKRQTEGIAVRKAKGLPFGRPKVTYPEGWEKSYKQWKHGDIKAVEFMNICSLKKTSFYKLVKEYERAM